MLASVEERMNGTGDGIAGSLFALRSSSHHPFITLPILDITS
jgi:hypothetical protein